MRGSAALHPEFVAHGKAQRVVSSLAISRVGGAGESLANGVGGIGAAGAFEPSGPSFVGDGVGGIEVKQLTYGVEEEFVVRFIHAGTNQ